MTRYPPRGYYVCECPDFNCHEPVSITADEYDALPVQTFIVVNSCEHPPDNPVVEQRKDYSVRKGVRYALMP